MALGKRIERAIVVGASSGMGEALVHQLAEAGAKVVAVARRRDRLDALAQRHEGRVLPLVHDVTHFDQAPEAFRRACDWLGGLDLIIYAAGVMPEVASSEFNFGKDREIIEVNLLGAIAWLNQAAIRFQGVKSGAILAIGSVAGDRGRQGQPVYNTSKAALATYTEALRNRLSKHGVTVSLVKPGPVATEMTARAGLKPKMSAEQAAKIILRKGLRTGEHYLSFAHRILFAIIRAVPSPLFRKLKL